MGKLLLLIISFSLVFFVTGISFAGEGDSELKNDTSVEKNKILIKERTAQLITEGKDVDDITKVLLNEGYHPTDISKVLVSTKLVLSANESNEVVSRNSDILGYTPPPGLAKNPAASRVRSVVLPSGAAGKNSNAGSFASPATF